MKIAAINSIKYANNQQYNKNTAAKIPQGFQRGVYNPVYYKDYNIQISFGKRTPEDFYSQDFNRDNMPETMKKYLYAKFDERSKIAPVQIMQEAFDGLEAAATVDDIKELFPNEPKFQKLRPANYNNATSGVLKKIKEIKAMQEVPEPLFKDGTDDLTTYLVKKIYLEGKTAKEIDNDFAKDINSVYELAAKVTDKTAAGKNESVYFSHSTMYNLGIRFPEVPFWNSFIATRDDYERTKRVKTLTGEFVNADSAEGKAAIRQRSRTNCTDKPEPRKYNFKRDRVKNISDTIVNSNGDTQKALREVHRRGRNPEELTFVQKYLSQIMTLATEKIHLSEEMIYFNESRRNMHNKLDGSVILDKLISGEDLTKRESTPFKEFWRQNPYLKTEFSTAITDSIMQLTDAYGADGNNTYFKLLLEDIARIKPDREKAKLEHARIQAEYDELAKSLQAEENMARKAAEEAKTTVQDIQAAPKPQKFKYVIDGHEIETPFDIKQYAYKAFETDFKMVPRKIFDIYMREQAKVIKDNPEKFYISCCFEKSDDTPEINKVLYSNEDLYQISDDLIAEMEINHNAELESCRMTLLEYAGRHNLATPEEIKKFANSDILRIRDNLYKKVLESGDVEMAHKEIQEIFKTVHTSLYNKEKISIKHKLVQLLKEYNPRNSMSPGTSVPAMIELLSDGMQRHAPYAEAIKSLLGEDAIMNFEGPSLRYLLKENVNPLFKHLISEHTFKSLIYLHPGDCSIIVTSNAENFVRLMSSFPSEREAIYSLSKRVIASTAGLLK